MMNGKFCKLLAILVLAFSGPLAAQDYAQAVQQGIELLAEGDVVAAMQEFRPAAEAGYAPAQVQLAFMLDKSEENDDARAWYQKAADQGDVNGQFGLAEMYGTGEGGEQSYEQAYFWFQKSAEGGYVPAMRLLAVNLLEGGLGVEADPDQAYSWLRKAAESGDEWASGELENWESKQADKSEDNPQQ